MKYIVILGVAPQPVTYVGPFDTQALADGHAAEHRSTNPGVTVTVDVLIDPANC